MTADELPPPRRIIWFDPGETTGAALWLPDTQFFTSFELGSLHLTGELLKRHLSPLTWVGYEAYTVRPGGARVKFRPDSLEVIGMVKWLVWEHQARLLPPQQAADRKIGVLHLKKLGWHRPGGDDDNAAAAHLLAFLLSQQLLPAELLKKITSQEGDAHDCS